MNDVFVDTSAFFALANLADRHHTEALAAFETTVGQAHLDTSDHVVVETWDLIRSRIGRNAAMRFWDGFDGGVITVVGAKAEDFRRGRGIAQAWSDQTFSIVACTSFALIERLGIAGRSPSTGTFGSSDSAGGATLRWRSCRTDREPRFAHPRPGCKVAASAVPASASAVMARNAPPPMSP